MSSLFRFLLALALFLFIAISGMQSTDTALALAPPLPAMSMPPAADADVYAYTYRNWNNSNVGKNTSLTAGYHPTGGERRIYLHFDLTVVPQVQSAILKLFHYNTGGNNTLRLGVFEVLSPWIEGNGTYHSGQVEPDASPGEISWANQPQISATPAVVFPLPASTGSFVEVDITALVQRWLSGAPNYGLVIKPVDPLSPQVGQSVYNFISREHENLEQRPILLINNGDGPPVVDPPKANSLKLFDPVPGQSSDAFKQNLYQQVAMVTASWDKTPYHMQPQFSSTLVINPGQKVFLSSDPNTQAPIKVDNFLLFEVEHQGFVSRFVVGEMEPVLYNGSAVPRLMPGGFSYPADTDLSGLFPKGVPFTLTVSALDYGGRAELSAVYLLLP